jgi:cell division protein FtsQ
MDRAMLPFARRRTRVILGIAVLLAVLAPLAFWLRTSSLVRVENVSVTGIHGSQAPQIERALAAAARDMTTLDVREEALRSAVSAYPVVRSLRTETDFPHGLRISVNAYEPVAAIRAGSGLTAVAGDGTLLRGSATRDLPVITIDGERGGERLRQGHALGAVQLLAAAPRALRGRVARVYLGPRGLTTTMQDGPRLYFGGASRPIAKWAAAAQVIASSTSRGAAYLDLRVPEKPVAGGLRPRTAETQPVL